MEGFTIWLTGLPGSGKTTLAKLLIAALERLGFRVELLSEDALKRELCPKFDSSGDESDSWLRLVVYLCSRFNEHGVLTIVDSVSATQNSRSYARQRIAPFVELFVECQPEVCLRRLYEHQPTTSKAHVEDSKAMGGRAYENPVNPEIRVNTEVAPPNVCVEQIIQGLAGLEMLGPDEDEEVVLARLRALGYVN